MTRYKRPSPVSDLRATHEGEWQSWRGMKERCRSKAHDKYKNYGGRGIKVCDRWLGKDGFINFVSDMGKKPNRSYSIDRIDNDGDYEPSNCRWVTQKEQLYNSSVVKKLTIDGTTDTITGHLKRVGISYGLYYQRITAGMSKEEAITAPKIWDDYLESKRQKRRDRIKNCATCGNKCKGPKTKYCSRECYIKNRFYS